MPHSASPPETPRIIYDLGANNGDDIPYYLLKADKVVAVEANPALAAGIRERFAAELASGRLAVENCVLVERGRGTSVPFHLHRRRHILSRFAPPAPQERDDFETVELPALDTSTLLARHGAPWYVKIDVEGYDQVILRELFECGVRPPFVSAESHDIEVFALLVAMGQYRAFNLVDGETVPTRYRNHPIAPRTGSVDYSFPPHSAGPFGIDIDRPWLAPAEFATLLALVGMGWKDIHATSELEPDPTFKPSPEGYLRERLITRLTPRPLRRFFGPSLRRY